jgi:translation elongation factor EF-1alpha
MGICPTYIGLCSDCLLAFVQIVILEHKSIICAGYSCMLHIHTCAEEVTIRVRTLPSHYTIQCCRVVENFIVIVEQHIHCHHTTQFSAVG